MLGFCRGALRHRCRMGITGLASFLVLVWIGSGTDSAWWSPPTASTVPTLGEGVVSGVFVAPGAGDISSCHLSLRNHSEFLISMATGEPRVRPWRIPPSSVSSSCSKR